MTILMNTRLSQFHQDHQKAVNAAFPKGARIDPARVASDPDLMRSVDHMLNYYEFVALALDKRDLDESIVRGAIRGQLVNFAVRARDYIAECRSEVNAKPADPAAYFVYENLVNLAGRWHQFHVDRCRRLAKKLAKRT